MGMKVHIIFSSIYQLLQVTILINPFELDILLVSLQGTLFSHSYFFRRYHNHT